MECNSICLGIKQFFGNLLSEVAFWVAIVISAIIAMRVAVSLYRDIRSKVREKQLMRIESEIEELVRTIIKEYPSPRLTSTYIPQRFPSKRAAQVFGERWSRGDRDSFVAKAVDASENDEDHPKFDKTSVGSGRLYPIPALFFGMKDAHRDDDDWWLDYQRAEKLWLKNYLIQLRKGTTPY